MGQLAAPLMLAEGAIGMYGASRQAGAIRQQGRYEQHQAGINARLASLQAEDAIRRGEEDAGRIRGAAKRVQGSQRAALASQGVNVNVGSAADVQAETETLGELDAITARGNAYREAWGHRVQAQGYLNQGAMARRAARSNARNTLLTGGLGFARSAAQGAFSARNS